MSGRFPRSVCTRALAAAAVLALAATSATATAAAPARPAAPTDKPISELLSQLQTLYQRAEKSTEAYNAVADDLKAQRTAVKQADTELAAARTALAGSRDDAGRLARVQYRGAGADALSPYVQLLLSSSPRDLADQRYVLKRAARDQAASVARLSGGERRLDGLATRARGALDRQQTLAGKRKRQRDAVQHRLDAVQTMLASLTDDQLAELRLLEQRDMDEAQRELLASGDLSRAGVPSRAGKRALAYAFGQLGKPYVWGATGPASFDCSGLTSRAWSRAGKPIPRTSQQQWRQLPRVPLSALRPGDLVVYFPGATHVAIYIGGGLVVQAPRPGSVVKVSPIAANPLLGAVRPDPAAKPLARYRPPPLPPGASVSAGARSGDDTGYNAAVASK
ncbi:C40 family peptidase [Streptomyces sp. H27-D2]|uniref:C40 family peptidase n=1 Tax=Streptomyces sp. H27-D2 TaxID=3046304 RepID=UPI002DB72B86|nr:C40 family peptidase [Streptomyces sp. H27-D2]MEC4018704.1 C40 family peptidase [Streptomyces sp. H27-D2]